MNIPQPILEFLIGQRDDDKIAIDWLKKGFVWGYLRALKEYNCYEKEPNKEKRAIMDKIICMAEIEAPKELQGYKDMWKKVMDNYWKKREKEKNDRTN